MQVFIAITVVAKDPGVSITVRSGREEDEKKGEAVEIAWNDLNEAHARFICENVPLHHQCNLWITHQKAYEYGLCLYER